MIGRSHALMMIYFMPHSRVVIEVLSDVLGGYGDAVRPVSIIGLGISLLRIIWISTLFAEIHTLFVLCPCYPVSWALTSTVMFLYYRKGGWKNRGALLLTDRCRKEYS